MLWIKIKYRLTLLCNKLLFGLGFEKYLLRNRYGERILVFHGVDSDGNTAYNSRFISKAYFEELIVFFIEHYNILSVSDFYEKKFKPNTLNIALTFDDGYLNNYTYVIPILEKYKVPASFYITTIQGQKEFLWADFIDLSTYYSSKKEVVFEEKIYSKNRTNEFQHAGLTLKNRCKQIPYTHIETVYPVFEEEWEFVKQLHIEDYWKLMPLSLLAEIDKNPLFTIGCHALTHANLVAIDFETAKREIDRSKQILEENGITEVLEFAFPFGYYTNALISYCKILGFKRILLVDYNQKTDHIETTTRNRFVVNPYISKNHLLASLLKGSYF